MEKLLVPKTEQTPSVLIDQIQGIIEIEGRSIPEDSMKFYKPVFDWVNRLSEGKIPPQTVVNMKLEYFDTSSFKCLWDFFEMLEKFPEKGKKVDVNWFYEKDDIEMLETGKDFKENIKLPFKLVPVDELF